MVPRPPDRGTYITWNDGRGILGRCLPLGCPGQVRYHANPITVSSRLAQQGTLTRGQRVQGRLQVQDQGLQARELSLLRWDDRSHPA